MTASVGKDKHGPIWVLGNIAVGTPGTPVNIMSLVDSASINAPESPVPGTTGADEYAIRAYEILFQACKAGATHGTALNTGNIYICKRGNGTGTGNRDDTGAIIATISQGASGIFPPIFRLTAAALNRNVFSPYEFYIDADNAADGCQVTLLIQ